MQHWVCFVIYLATWAPVLLGNQFTGDVIEVDHQARHLVFVDGLSFPVAPGELDVGWEGRRVTGKLETVDDELRLHRIWPADDDPVYRPMRAINKALYQTADLRGKALKTGDRIPGFALLDQNAQVVTPRELLGKNVVIHFIFTRCQVAEMCPASTAKMAQLDRLAQAADLENYQLVTVTFDPEYDTPGVLNFYGRQRGLDFEHHRLLTGDAQAIESLLVLFGVLTRHENGTIDHTMTVSLLNKRGRVEWMHFGPDWQPEAFLERLTALD